MNSAAEIFLPFLDFVDLSFPDSGIAIGSVLGTVVCTRAL